ncbi:hypothetical protein CDAR_429851 [Caerostris darwini]|uniref:Uncharacterized protein n=1 Tax=Caerostris darwini TaxID=1538125 RepID=A0AAV4VVK9_9ARAC|nr:hypothetical protein CDAR_429851 [Caerostris darwini]
MFNLFNNGNNKSPMLNNVCSFGKLHNNYDLQLNKWPQNAEFISMLVISKGFKSATFSSNRWLSPPMFATHFVYKSSRTLIKAPNLPSSNTAGRWSSGSQNTFIIIGEGLLSKPGEEYVVENIILSPKLGIVQGILINASGMKL